MGPPNLLATSSDEGLVVGDRDVMAIVVLPGVATTVLVIVSVEFCFFSSVEVGVIAVAAAVAAGDAVGTVVVAVTIDNLVKGASGQAIQNMNIMFGLPESAGLNQVGLLP